VCDYEVEPHLSGAAWGKKIVVLHYESKYSIAMIEKLIHIGL